MAKLKPTLKIKLDFASGKCFVISLYLVSGGITGRYFKVTFKDCDGTTAKSKHGCTVTNVVNRLRMLIVREIV